MICLSCNQEAVCPDCGGSVGSLGTSFAYFVCPNVHEVDPGRHERYWYLRDYSTGRYQEEWKKAVMASPHGRCGSGARLFEPGGAC